MWGRRGSEGVGLGRWGVADRGWGETLFLVCLYRCTYAMQLETCSCLYLCHLCC